MGVPMLCNRSIEEEEFLVYRDLILCSHYTPTAASWSLSVTVELRFFCDPVNWSPSSGNREISRRRPFSKPSRYLLPSLYQVFPQKPVCLRLPVLVRTAVEQRSISQGNVQKLQAAPSSIRDLSVSARLYHLHYPTLQPSLSVPVPVNYVGHLESKERLRIQPAQLFNFS